VQFHFWKYINRNQTFLLDSNRPFIYCVLVICYVLRKKNSKRGKEGAVIVEGRVRVVGAK
jgi:hypothetical protein